MHIPCTGREAILGFGKTDGTWCRAHRAWIQVCEWVPFQVILGSAASLLSSPAAMSSILQKGTLKTSFNICNTSLIHYTRVQSIELLQDCSKETRGLLSKCLWMSSVCYFLWTECTRIAFHTVIYLQKTHPLTSICWAILGLTMNSEVKWAQFRTVFHVKSGI